MIECDVLVVGAGPAGSVAALSALHHGATNILIIEKESKISESKSPKIDFVESIGLADIMNELNFSVDYISYKSKWYSPSNMCFSFESRIADYWIKRGPSKDSFESKMVNSAVKHGAELLLNTEVIQYTKNVVTVKKDNKTEEIRANVIIDAEGLHSNIARSLDIDNNSKNPVKEIIAYGVAGYDFDMEEGVPNIFFNSKYAPGSYILICKNPNDGEGYMIQGIEKVKGVNPSHYFQKLLGSNRILQNILKNAEITQNIHGTLYVISSLPSRLKINNILLVGDSARLMDPFLHYGLGSAIISGYLSGKIAADYLPANDISYLNKYEMLIKETLYAELNRRIKYRKIFSKLNDSDIEKVFKLLISLKEKNVNFDLLFENPYEYLPQILKALIKNLSCTPLIPKTLIGSH